LRWPEFRSRYADELGDKRSLLDDLAVRAKEGPLTLLYSARDEARNQAVVIKAVLAG
jgi:uncharacterized protein YeaO (DUF488 family)